MSEHTEQYGEQWREVYDYDPLHDDAQAMALVKRFKLWTGYDDTDNGWKVRPWPYLPNDDGPYGLGFDLNRAIVECVAQMQAPIKSTSNV